MNNAQQLDAVQQRHADVQHNQVKQLLFQDGQRLACGWGRMDFPVFIRLAAKHVVDQFEEGQAVIHEKHAIDFLAVRGFRLFFRGGERSTGRCRCGCSGRRHGGGFGYFKAQLHDAQAQNLPALQDGLGNRLAADERAVG